MPRVVEHDWCIHNGFVMKLIDVGAEPIRSRGNLLAGHCQGRAGPVHHKASTRIELFVCKAMRDDFRPNASGVAHGDANEWSRCV